MCECCDEEEEIVKPLEDYTREELVMTEDLIELPILKALEERERCRREQICYRKRICYLGRRGFLTIAQEKPYRCCLCRRYAYCLDKEDEEYFYYCVKHFPRG